MLERAIDEFLEAYYTKDEKIERIDGILACLRDEEEIERLYFYYLKQKEAEEKADKQAEKEEEQF